MKTSEQHIKLPLTSNYNNPLSTNESTIKQRNPQTSIYMPMTTTSSEYANNIGTIGTLNSIRSTSLVQQSPFETFLKKHPVNNFINQNYQSNQNEIISAINPHLERLRQREFELNQALTEANNYYELYKKNQTALDEESKTYQSKKEKLKYVYHSLFQFKNMLLNKEKELALREEQLRQYEMHLKENEQILEQNSIKFETYVTEKSNQMKQDANMLKEIKEGNETRNIELLKREQEIALREDKLLINEQEYRNQRDEMATQQLKQQWNKMQEANKQYNNNNRNDNVKKELIQRNINSDNVFNIENKKATIDLLDQQIEQKKRELNILNSQCDEKNQEINVKLSELNERLLNVNKREQEINLLKQELERKLEEIEQKLSETQRLSSELKENEMYLIKQYHK
jgi:hypothetical protein